MTVTPSQDASTIPFDEYEILVGIEKLWKEQGHCMRYGSSRETLAHWYKEVTGVRVKPQVIRRVLMKMVLAHQCDKAQSNSGHSIFLLKEAPEVKETEDLFFDLKQLQELAREKGYNIEAVSFYGVRSEEGITHNEVDGIKIIHK